MQRTGRGQDGTGADSELGSKSSAVLQLGFIVDITKVFFHLSVQGAQRACERARLLGAERWPGGCVSGLWLT